jgi:uncharacterized protein (TIGR03083 family)
VGALVDVAHGQFFGGHTINVLDQWRDIEVQQTRDAMTARQVAERRNHSVLELTEEWRNATPAVLPLMRGEVPVPPSLPPYIPLMAVADVVVHETDIRGALGLGRAPTTPALSVALAAYSFSLENRIRELGLPALALEYDGKQRQLGDNGVGATLRADRHELVRVMAGRRTRDQILRLEWEGDPSPFLDILAEYGPVTPSTTD